MSAAIQKGDQVVWVGSKNQMPQGQVGLVLSKNGRSVLVDWGHRSARHTLGHEVVRPETAAKRGLVPNPKQNSDKLAKLKAEAKKEPIEHPPLIRPVEALVIEEPEPAKPELYDGSAYDPWEDEASGMNFQTAILTVAGAVLALLAIVALVVAISGGSSKTAYHTPSYHTITHVYHGQPLIIDVPNK